MEFYASKLNWKAMKHLSLILPIRLNIIINFDSTQVWFQSKTVLQVMKEQELMAYCPLISMLLFLRLVICIPNHFLAPELQKVTRVSVELDTIFAILPASQMTKWMQNMLIVCTTDFKAKKLNVTANLLCTFTAKKIKYYYKS